VVSTRFGRGVRLFTFLTLFSSFSFPALSPDEVGTALCSCFFFLCFKYPAYVSLPRSALAQAISFAPLSFKATPGFEFSSVTLSLHPFSKGKFIIVCYSGHRRAGRTSGPHPVLHFCFAPLLVSDVVFDFAQGFPPPVDMGRVFGSLVFFSTPIPSTPAILWNFFFLLHPPYTSTNGDSITFFNITPTFGPLVAPGSLLATSNPPPLPVLDSLTLSIYPPLLILPTVSLKCVRFPLYHLSIQVWGRIIGRV